MTAGTIQKTGKLRFSRRAPLGIDQFDWYVCVDCGTEYPQADSGSTMCNGHIIDLCPWCRPDSAPWKHGRGE